ncbi:MAG: hypothetical protein WC782_14825 [Methylococcaceae bacterium]
MLNGKRPILLLPASLACHYYWCNLSIGLTANRYPTNGGMNVRIRLAPNPTYLTGHWQVSTFDWRGVFFMLTQQIKVLYANH